MATSSFLGGRHIPEEPMGKDTDALGPSDNSDSGSDAQGAYGEGELASDSDAEGTGVRSGLDQGRDDADILPDHIEGDDVDDEDVFLDNSVSIESLASDDDEFDDVEDE